MIRMYNCVLKNGLQVKLCEEGEWIIVETFATN